MIEVVDLCEDIVRETASTSQRLFLAVYLFLDDGEVRLVILFLAGDDLVAVGYYL